MPLAHVIFNFLDLDFDPGAGDLPLPFSFMALSFGVLVLGAAFLPVLLRCGLYFLAFSAAGVLASATGQRQCGQICRLFADGAGLCASVLTLYFFMVFLSTLLLLITGSGG